MEDHKTQHLLINYEKVTKYGVIIMFFFGDGGQPKKVMPLGALGVI